MFNFFKRKVEKEEFEQLKQAVQTGFGDVKQDVGDVGKWIKHLDSSDIEFKADISELREELATVKEELENLKNMVSIVGNREAFKQGSTVFNKQTVFKGVLNSVQTGVQTAFLDKLSTTERAIVYILLNSDMKLSYADLAAMLGKRRATIRGQINSIKQKSEGLIEEIVSENNKKRIFIPEKVKTALLKTQSVKNTRKREK